MMKQSVFLFLLLFVNAAFAQQPVGIFQFNEDIGAVKHPGSASYDEGTQVYSISGSGANVWNRKE